ncbi:Putative hemiasterlin resistant protein 1-like [Arachis hypogaea]|nr:Putative hemiasterlin resistant protein 1-like [Arachis hypogaea]
MSSDCFIRASRRRTSWWWLEICDWEALVGLAREECVLGSGKAGGRRGSLSSGAGKRNRIGVLARTYPDRTLPVAGSLPYPNGLDRVGYPQVEYELPALVRREVSLHSIRVGWVFGLVFGAGFALANWVLGPKPPTVNVTAPPPPADNVTAAPALQQVDGDPCSFRAITKLLDCINSSKNEKAINKCQVYMDRLVACRKDHLSKFIRAEPLRSQITIRCSLFLSITFSKVSENSI